jgi:hypothetical protein
MTIEQRQQQEQGIVADLHDPNLTYIAVAYRNRVGTATVIMYAKKHGLTRKRGRKTGSTARQVKE